jgi:hypothetical protein
MSSTVRKDIPERSVTTDELVSTFEFSDICNTSFWSKFKAIIMFNIIKEVSCQVFVSANMQFFIL